MKKLSILAVPAFAAVMAISASSFAATESTTASVTIKTPIAVTETTPMTFGTVIPTNAAATADVVLDFADGATSTNATITGASSGDFNVTGAGTSSFSLSGLGTVVMSNGTPADDMQLVLTSSVALGTQALSGGALPIAVGGTLTVGANQPSGAYTANYAVTVNY